MTEARAKNILTALVKQWADQYGVEIKDLKIERKNNDNITEEKTA